MKLRILKKNLRKLRKLNIRYFVKGHKQNKYIGTITGLYLGYLLLAGKTMETLMRKSLKAYKTSYSVQNLICSRRRLLTKRFDIYRSIKPLIQIESTTGKRKEIK